jgi:hypothetical protein
MGESVTTCRMMIEHNDLWITTLVMIMLITETDESQESLKGSWRALLSLLDFYDVICCEGF